MDIWLWHALDAAQQEPTIVKPHPKITNLQRTELSSRGACSEHAGDGKGDGGRCSSPCLEAEHINDEAAGAQALEQQRVRLVLAGAEQLELTHGRQLQAHLQRAHTPAQLRHLAPSHRQFRLLQFQNCW